MQIVVCVNNVWNTYARNIILGYATAHNRIQNPYHVMNNIYNNPNYADVIIELKVKLKNLMIKFEDNKTLVDFRKITDTDFGRIVDNINDEESVQQILTKKKN